MAIRTSEDEKKRQKQQEELKAKRQTFWVYTKDVLAGTIILAGVIVIIIIALFLAAWKVMHRNALGEVYFNIILIFLFAAGIFLGIAVLCQVLANALYKKEYTRDPKYSKRSKKSKRDFHIRKTR